MAGDEQPAGHTQSHLAQADESDSGHPAPPLELRSIAESPLRLGEGR
jgi:hypothetical protein